MTADVYHVSSKLGSVSESGEDYCNDRKAGWVNGIGDIYAAARKADEQVLAITQEVADCDGVSLIAG